MGLQRVVNFMNNSGDVCLRTWSRTNLAPSHSERRTDILESKSVTSEESKRRLKPWMYRAGFSNWLSLRRQDASMDACRIGSRNAKLPDRKGLIINGETLGSNGVRGI